MQTPLTRGLFCLLRSSFGEVGSQHFFSLNNGKRLLWLFSPRGWSCIRLHVLFSAGAVQPLKKPTLHNSAPMANTWPIVRRCLVLRREGLNQAGCLSYLEWRQCTADCNIWRKTPNLKPKKRITISLRKVHCYSIIYLLDQLAQIKYDQHNTSWIP